MSHDYHEGLPGFSPSQMLHDGCGECEARSRRDDHGIANLDPDNFRRALLRAREWNDRGLLTMSDAERPMLSALWSVLIQCERIGVQL